MPNVTGKRIFVIGDSHSAYAGSPGEVLASALRAAGASKVTVNGRSGRSAYSFLRRGGSETLQAVASEGQPPDMAIVMLGTNDIDLDNAAATRKAFETIKNALRGIEVWGIGPPAFPGSSNYARNVAHMAALQSDVFGSRFIDARELTPSAGRSPDGIHFERAGAAVFGNALAKEFLSRGSPWLMVGVAAAAGLIAYWLWG